MATSYRLRSTCPPGTRIASVRQKSQEQKWFHSVGGLRAQKDTQHKDSLKPRSTEYSKSGGGDQAAATESAFDPSTSDPDEGTKKVERESDTVSEVLLVLKQRCAGSRRSIRYEGHDGRID